MPSTPRDVDDERQRRIRGRLVRFEATLNRIVVYSTATLPPREFER